jgi:DNA-directed RNA polymerase subunit beta
MESFAAIDAGDVIMATAAGVVTEVSSDVVTVQLDADEAFTLNPRRYANSAFHGISFFSRLLVIVFLLCFIKDLNLESGPMTYPIN